ncbi:HAMP domain-containing protein, partial [Thalassiella azotivora]
MKRFEWTVGRRVRVLGAVGALSTLVIGWAAWDGMTKVDERREALSTASSAGSVMLQLDTRASEFKVLGYRALTADDPSALLADVAEDRATVEGLLDQLDALPLEGELAQAADGLRGPFTAFVDEVDAFIDASVEDQTAMQPRGDEIQAANGATDEAVGQALDVVTATMERETAALEGTAASVRTFNSVVTALMLALLVATVVVTTRAITRPLSRVLASLQRVAAGDLTEDVEVRSQGELGMLERGLRSTVESMRSVIASVTGSADAVASSSQELAASSQQIAAGAEETSVQA